MSGAASQCCAVLYLPPLFPRLRRIKNRKTLAPTAPPLRSEVEMRRGRGFAMKRMIPLFSLGLGLTLPAARAQDLHTGAHLNGAADTTHTVSAIVNSQNDSLHRAGGKLFDSWAGSGEAGWGVWFGPQNNEAFYLFTDSGKACITIHPSGKVHFANSLAVNGTTTTKILTVTGGTDIVE